MDLRNNIDDQREYLQRNLDNINTVVSALLGIKTYLTVEEKVDRYKTVYFNLIDDRNIRECCGVMAKAFKEVNIHTFGVWWKEDGVTMELDFFYEHIDGGSNSAKFCYLEVKDDFVKIV